ncbi:hypothetical protein [Granulosicoccus antarcticus]|uniref:Inner membrane protein YbhN n=1 Tax=Granulosicoccus antarcticus IMCC3135 TaxID=1192854 RepID=A0A2Z2P5A9_9GAMM|nr:hypothetical protein [Granulosicoccus antarcticus]ASJ75867.1 hypothetical protein IMCC3135_29080 [Granulosicoccus antarcticus IMCC3135]
MPKSYKKYLWAFCLSLLITTLCLILIYQLDKNSTVEHKSLPVNTYALFFLSVALIYGLSTILWKYFYSLFGRQRSSQDAFLDMGLIAIGKYLPGKIWGIALRGSFDQNQLKLDKGRILVSGLEQAFSLVMGILIVSALALSTRWTFGWIFGSICVISAYFLALLLLPFLKFILSRIKRIQTDLTMPSVGCRMLLGIGYTLLWLISAAPIVILMQSSLTLSTTELISIAAAFLGSMIAGWLALFAPGGIGVRESVFVILAPDFLSWDEGLYWIALHRGLFTLFDAFFGLLVLSLIAARARTVSLR